MTNTTDAVFADPPFPKPSQPVHPVQYGTTVAGLISDSEKLTLSLNRLLHEYPVMFKKPSNLGYFQFIMDQIQEELPRLHPMEIGQQLVLRLFPGDPNIIANVFWLGGLIDRTLRERTKAYDARTEMEMKLAAGMVQGWPIPSV